MTSPAKAYLVEFGSSMLAYVILLAGSIDVIERYPAAPWRYEIALVPVIPLCFALVAMLRFLGRIDELAKQIHLEGFAVAAGATAIATFGYGLLENVGLPLLSMTLVLPFTVAVWGLATAFATWRYR